MTGQLAAISAYRAEAPRQAEADKFLASLVAVEDCFHTDYVRQQPVHDDPGFLHEFTGSRITSRTPDLRINQEASHALHNAGY